MIIILGPDSSGKTTLREKIVEMGSRLYPDGDLLFKAQHHVQATGYDDYMEELSGQKSNPIPLQADPFVPGIFLESSVHWVLDRHFWCELPYSSILRKSTAKFSLKQFHNLHLATMAHNPVVILTTRKSPEYLDPDVPEELFQPLLDSYRGWLDLLDVEYIEWDYLTPPLKLAELISHEILRQEHVTWWRNMARRGIAGLGNTVNPRVLIIAEILSSNNVYHFPFEQGPSGYYLSELIDQADIPLSSFFLTNWKKTNNSTENQDLLKKELRRTGATDVIILGGEAKKAIPYLGEIESSDIHVMKHPGWVVNHSETLREMALRKAAFLSEWELTWRKILGGDVPYQVMADEEIVKVEE